MLDDEDKAYAFHYFTAYESLSRLRIIARRFELRLPYVSAKQNEKIYQTEKIQFLTICPRTVVLINGRKKQVDSQAKTNI